MYQKRNNASEIQYEYLSKILIHLDYDYKVGDKILIRKDGILRKAESI